MIKDEDNQKFMLRLEIETKDGKTTSEIADLCRLSVTLAHVKMILSACKVYGIKPTDQLVLMDKEGRVIDFSDWDSPE